MSLTTNLAALALLAAVAPLGAQVGLGDEGPWFGVGLGAGGGAVQCESCNPERRTGVAGHLAFGGSATRRLRYGVELNAWTRNSDTDSRIWVMSANLRYHLPFLPALSIRGGLGYLNFTSTTEGPDNTSVEFRSTGWAAITGLAWSIRVRHDFSLDPYVSYARQFQGELGLTGAPLGEDANVDLFQVGLGLTLYQGARD